ncbi:MAG: 3-methylaspartate ammonia-lyase [Elusimicrobia bacterium RIFOXYB2_FULL_49_7]|nr:MAG: 3-methylaspartate ammonia-lyase [Elusimicrobia bacterium RIFOXYB2_FULL_49_7]
MKKENEYRVLSPTAILGYGFPEGSFKKGVTLKPHCIAVDAGSTDPGPYYLGVGKSFTNRDAVKRDLRYMLVAGRKLKVPVIIGSAGGGGAKPHVDWCEEIIREIAQEEKLSFKMAVIYADIQKAAILSALKKKAIVPLSFVPELDEKTVQDSVNVVAQMGMEPIIKALDQGCEVILCGRCYDPAVFAAMAVRQGFDAGLALHMGKILECAAIAATPGSGADCAMGFLREDHFELAPLSSERKFTQLSTAAHTLYEKSDPSHLPGPGGVIELDKCVFEERPGGRVRVSGSRFVPGNPYYIKLEGVRRAGYRTISVAGTRDPVMLAEIDTILNAVRKQVMERSEKDGVVGRVDFHVYGKNGVMRELEPVKKTGSHELGLVMEAVADTQKAADTLCSLVRSTLLHYGYPGRLSTAGNLAFPFSPSDASMGEVFEFSLYHLMPVKDPAAFPMKTADIGRRKA